MLKFSGPPPPPPERPAPPAGASGFVKPERPETLISNLPELPETASYKRQLGTASVECGCSQEQMLLFLFCFLTVSLLIVTQMEGMGPK